MQLTPAALHSRQLSQHSSETAPAEAVAAGHDSPGPLGEAAAETDMGAGADPHGPSHPTVSTNYILPAMLARAPKDGRQTAFSHSLKHAVSQLPVCLESLKRSASLPAGLAAVPAAAAEISTTKDAVSKEKRSPESSLAHGQGKLESLDWVQGHIAKGPLGAADPISSLGVPKGELQPAYSLPPVSAAAVVAPSLPTAASPSAATAAAADRVLHNQPRNSAASNLPRSAFRPYNGYSFSLSTHGPATADTANGYVPGSAAGKPHDNGLDTQGSNCKAPMAEDKENLLPAKISRPTLHVSQDPASMIDRGSGKLSGAVSKSAVSSAGQSVGGLSSADEVHDATVNAHHLGHAGAESTDPGNNAASKRAKLTHDVDQLYM